MTINMVVLAHASTRKYAQVRANTRKHAQIRASTRKFHALHKATRELILGRRKENRKEEEVIVKFELIKRVIFEFKCHYH